MENWTINEEQAMKILETDPVIINEPDAFNYLDLSKEERKKHVRKILEIWRNKHGE